MSTRNVKAVAGVLIAIGLMSTCRPAAPAHPAGIALSFDDRFIGEWYQLRPLFRKYNARATFYITQFDSLTPLEITQLKTLRQDGHEIGCHGAIHTNSVHYVRQHSMPQYLDAEIYPALRSMHKHGFRPTSFAHPGGAHTDAIDGELLNHFVLLRDVALLERTIWGITLRWNIHLMPGIYHHFDDDPTVDALLFDEGAGLGLSDLRTAMRKAKEEGTALMLFGHKPYQRSVEAGRYGFLVERLDSILAESRRLKLRTYTMSELIQRSDR
ncbi:MAG: polysaccharide deacetylase family protein [Bacteroidetes bacterium]|nr:polysaccharide deacetylase family protein [Fibrella sp.]